MRLSCEESALRPRRDRRPSRRCRFPPLSRCVQGPLHCAAFSRSAPRSGTRRASYLRPSLAVSAERLRCTSPLGVLPRECLRLLRTRSRFPSPRTARAMEPHALHAGRSAHRVRPPSPLAQPGPAPTHRCRVRSRGSRPAGRHNARLRAGSCLSRRGTRHPWRAKPRARVIRRYVSRPASTSLCSPRCAAPAARCWRVHARAARVCAPSLACCLVWACGVARGLLCATPAGVSPRARIRRPRGAAA
jgi:hypothetical protein